MPADLLEGVRVLDLTNVLAGPFAGYQLGLMGADVIKVEVPGTGDLARNLGADPELSAAGLGISFLAQNAGKRSITLDLKNPAGREVFERLVREADVLLENFRPGVLARLGFPVETLQELNPGLVYCAVSGFGQTGPMRDRPAYDQIIQGLSGIMSVTGTPESAPTRTGFPIADTLGGYAAAFAISAALVKRTRTGTGSYLDVSMLETAVAAMGWVVSDYLIGGRTPQPMGNENATSAPSGTFRTADGDLNIAANKQEQYEELCRALHRQDLLNDPRFATRESRKHHREALKTELEKTLQQNTATHWDALLSTTNVPSAPVLTVPQALALDQLHSRHLIHTLPMPEPHPHPTPDADTLSTPEADTLATPAAHPHPTPEADTLPTPAAHLHPTPEADTLPTPQTHPHLMPEARPHSTPDDHPHPTPDAGTLPTPGTLPAPEARGYLQVLGSSTHVDGRPTAPATRPPHLGEHTEAILADLGYTPAEIAALASKGAT